ncbi:MAG: DUF423 domain-containing protein, partial [Gammaproteobacteria bacterium]
EYLLVHAAALAVVALALGGGAASKPLFLAGGAMCAGIILFCGGLSVASLSGVAAFGSAAPVGGSALIVGWLALAVHGLIKT